MNNVLEELVLVLNKYYLAIKVYTVRAAICDLSACKALVIEEDYTTYDLKQWIEFSKKVQQDRCTIHSPSTSIYIPYVVYLFKISTRRLEKYDINQVKYSRKNVIQRDNYTCQYCGKSIGPMTVDHIVPRSKGGQSNWDNLVACCKRCNSQKGDKTLDQLGWNLIQQPIVPQWKSYTDKRFDSIRNKHWLPFLRKE